MKNLSTIKAFTIEVYKIKRLKLPLILVSMISVQVLWIAEAMNDAIDEVILLGYTSCLYQIPMLNAIFLPVFIGVLVSRICDMEHKQNSFKQLFTMQDSKQLFATKFIIISLGVVLAITLQICSIYGIGQFYNFGDAFNLKDFALYFLSQSICSIFLVLLIQIFALIFSNQFIPFVIGLLAGFLGLVSMFFPPWLMRLVPSSYYGLLSTVGMNWDASTRIATYYSKTFPIFDFIRLMVVMILLYIIGRVIFSKKDV